MIHPQVAVKAGAGNYQADRTGTLFLEYSISWWLKGAASGHEKEGFRTKNCAKAQWPVKSEREENAPCSPA